MPIKCRECGAVGKHLTMQCSLRSPSERPKGWEQIVAETGKKEQDQPLHCKVPLHPGKDTVVHAKTPQEFWEDIRVAHQHSLYRDYAGILNTETGELVPPEHAVVQAGSYVLVGRTSSMSDEALYDALDNARDILLSQERPLSNSKVCRVHEGLLLDFNHFSLQHEGSNLGLDATEMITILLAGNDPKRGIEHEELDKIQKDVPGSKFDIKEAVNHILVSQHLQELARNDITETTVLQLHSSVMDGLLTEFEEGGPGEYRKVSINIQGSNSLRPHFADVAPLMSTWCNRDLKQQEDEHIIDFLSRIHSSFQDIHPFRDGNGRVGRLVMNMFLLKQGYPVLTFLPTLSAMFNQGVSTGVRKNYTIFSRLLAEVLFSSFQAYENALGVKLLPTVEDTIKCAGVLT